jgi:hypothetical protein
MSMTSNAHAEAVSADSFPRFVMMRMGDAPFFVWFESKEQYKKYVAHVDTITNHYNKYVHFVNGHNGKLVLTDPQTIYLASRVIADYESMRESFDESQMCPGFVRQVNFLRDHVYKVDWNAVDQMLDDDCFPREITVQLMDEPFSVRFESKKEFKKYAAFMTEIRKWYNAFVTHADTEDGARIGDAETRVQCNHSIEHSRLILLVRMPDGVQDPNQHWFHFDLCEFEYLPLNCELVCQANQLRPLSNPNENCRGLLRICLGGNVSGISREESAQGR